MQHLRYAELPRLLEEVSELIVGSRR